MTAPSPIPIRNARIFPLPEWYLPKGTINASNQQLEGASSSCERWGIGFAGVVVIAVIAELVIAWAQPPYLSFLTYSAIADAVIAVGIAGEILLGTIWNNRIQTELRTRSNEQLASAIQSAADANERAAKAEYELARFRAPRFLTNDQMASISKKLRKFEGTQFDAAVQSNDPEIIGCLISIQMALVWAGWKSLPWAGPGELSAMAMPGIHVGVGFSVTGITISIHPDSAGVLHNAATALAAELSAVPDMKSTVSVPQAPLAFDISANTQAIHVLVGRKT